MMARNFGRIVNITSGAVKAPIATPGLTGFITSQNLLGAFPGTL